MRDRVAGWITTGVFLLEGPVITTGAVLVAVRPGTLGDMDPFLAGVLLGLCLLVLPVAWFMTVGTVIWRHDLK